MIDNNNDNNNQNNDNENHNQKNKGTPACAGIRPLDASWESAKKLI